MRASSRVHRPFSDLKKSAIELESILFPSPNLTPTTSRLWIVPTEYFKNDLRSTKQASGGCSLVLSPRFPFGPYLEQAVNREGERMALVKHGEMSPRLEAGRAAAVPLSNLILGDPWRKIFCLCTWR